MCINQCVVCWGTPVASTGRPHPKLSTKLAIEKRRRRQKRFGEPFRGARISGAGSFEVIVGQLGQIRIIHKFNWPSCFALAAHSAEFRGGYLRFRDSAFMAKILGGATDGSNAGGSTVVYNLMSLPSIIANRGVPIR